MRPFSNRARLLTVILLGAVLFVIPKNVSGQSTAVSPRQFKDIEMPDVANVDGTPSYRLQQVYSKADFAHLGDGPYTITRIDWRPDRTMEANIDYPADNFRMRFATTLAEPAGNDGPLDLTFANNINGNLQTVFDDAVTLTTLNLGPTVGPNEFDYGLDFESPYLYDPGQGNLLMDLFVIDGKGPLLLDWSLAPTETTSFIWSGSLGSESVIAEAGQFGGHALQFTIVPEPSAFTSVLISSCVFVWQRRTMNCRYQTKN